MILLTGSLKSPRVLADTDCFDITRGSGGSAGSPFAPSGALLWPTLREMRKGEPFASAAWARYEPAFEAEMDESERRFPEAWAGLEARQRVVLACACGKATTEPGGGLRPLRCHRVLVAARLLRRAGVDAATAKWPVGASLNVPTSDIYRGEIEFAIGRVRRGAA